MAAGALRARPPLAVRDSTGELVEKARMPCVKNAAQGQSTPIGRLSAIINVMMASLPKIAIGVLATTFAARLDRAPL